MIVCTLRSAVEIQGWKSKLFKSKDESISIVHTKSEELSIVDIRNKKQRLKKQKAKIIVIDAEIRTKFFRFFIRMH